MNFRASLTAQKKETEELQAGLLFQRKWMEVGFAVQKKELETEYQRQVDEMYFFGYRCCMKKNGIMHDIPFLLMMMKMRYPETLRDEMVPLMCSSSL